MPMGRLLARRAANIWADREPDLKASRASDCPVTARFSQGRFSQGGFSQGRFSQGRFSQGRVSQGRVSQGRVSQGRALNKKFSTSSRFVRNLRLLSAFGVMAEKVSPRAGESTSV
jgi:hypothetical protein